MVIVSRRFKTIEAISAELACCIFEEIVNESIDNLTSYSLKGWISELHVQSDQNMMAPQLSGIPMN